MLRHNIGFDDYAEWGESEYIPERKRLLKIRRLLEMSDVGDECFGVEYLVRKWKEKGVGFDLGGNW